MDAVASIDCMASITIRGLEETIKRNLRISAAMNGRSMEQEAREILKAAVGEPTAVSKEIQRRVAPPRGIECDRLALESIRRGFLLAGKGNAEAKSRIADSGAPGSETFMPSVGRVLRCEDD